MARNVEQAEVKKRSGKISKPAALKPGHDVSSFDCTREVINKWLKERAKKATESDTARTFVICRGTKLVIGFYALAAGSVEHAGAVGNIRRNAPDPIPVIILAMLGVDKNEQGQGLGPNLLADGMRRALNASRNIGARALLVHALDDEAEAFYKKLNFRQVSAADPRTLYISMKEMRDALS